MTVTINKARGCLLGQAIGDALGAPVEGLGRDRIQRHCGQVRGYLDPELLWMGRLGRAHLPGLYTDDTQQALLIADVLTEARGYDPELARRKYLELRQPVPGLPRGALRSHGGNFRAALERMAAGGHVLQTGVPSAGNGAAMRIAPIGLWYHADREGLRQAAVQASLQTHADARGISAAVAVAFLVGHLAAQAPDGAAGALAALEEAQSFVLDTEMALTAEDGLPACFSGVLRILTGLWTAPEWEVLRAIVIEANRQQPEHPITSPSDSFAGASVATAIYLALSSPSFEEAVVRAVNLGHDADTVGAITGALAGARWGAESIPQPWLDGLENRDGVLARADALAGGHKGGLAIPVELPTIERELALVQVRKREQW